ncbi:MAG: hypothetical protein HQ567_23975 [Candidatus Nealsonbacteria bacterium]|nr:hypothetical protein [Candidatus Nealsonbacteria bacterium]
MEGSPPPVCGSKGSREVAQPHQDPEAEAACDGSKTFGVPLSRLGTVGRTHPAPEGSSSIDTDLQLPEILARHRHALSFLIAAIRQMEERG